MGKRRRRSELELRPFCWQHVRDRSKPLSRFRSAANIDDRADKQLLCRAHSPPQVERLPGELRPLSQGGVTNTFQLFVCGAA